MNTRYEFNMDVPPREAIRLMYVSKSRFGGDWNSVPHTHSCTEVFYCVDGRGQFNVEGKMLDVAPTAEHMFPYSEKEIEEIMKTLPNNWDLIKDAFS